MGTYNSIDVISCLYREIYCYSITFIITSSLSIEHIATLYVVYPSFSVRCRGEVLVIRLLRPVYTTLLLVKEGRSYRGERKKNKWFYVSYIHTSMMTLVKKKARRRGEKYMNAPYRFLRLFRAGVWGERS